MTGIKSIHRLSVFDLEADVSRLRQAFFLGLVVIARAKHTIPSRTRPLSAVAPMVLRLKTWESRSPPNLVRRFEISLTMSQKNGRLSGRLFSCPIACLSLSAGWTGERQEVIDIFGSALTAEAALNGLTTRECLKVGAVQRLLVKCSDAQKKRAVKEIKKWDVDLAMEKYEAERLREAVQLANPARRHSASHKPRFCTA